LYRLFTDEDSVKVQKLPVNALSRMNEQDKKLLLSMAQGMARPAENVS
jgi:hypothetical protein